MSEYDIEYYHNKGQEDGANNEYDPPYDGIFLDVLMMDDEKLEKRRAYFLGYYHAKGEVDGVENNYDPPSSSGECGSEKREAYDAGWRTGYDSRD
jgi:hypothetical protein